MKDKAASSLGISMIFASNAAAVVSSPPVKILSSRVVSMGRVVPKWRPRRRTMSLLLRESRVARKQAQALAMEAAGDPTATWFQTLIREEIFFGTKTCSSSSSFCYKAQAMQGKGDFAARTAAKRPTYRFPKTAG